MNKRILLTALIALQLFVAMIAPVSAEQSGTAGTSAKATKTYGSNLANASMMGGYATSQQYFQLESYWNVEAVDLYLDYKATPLMQDEWSSVTLLLNGKPFHSFRPEVNDQEKQQLKVNVPLEFLQEGSNLLTVQGNIQTLKPGSELICWAADTKNSWLQLFDSSRIAVQYDTKPLEGTIRDFNVHFRGLDTVNDGKNAVVVPTNSDPAELEAAMYALSGLAKANPLKQNVIPLLELGSAGVKSKSAIVVVALYDHLTDDIKKLIKREDMQNKALLQVVQLGNTSALVITSDDAELLVRAGRLAANQSLLQQLDRSSKLVDATTEVETPAVEISKNVKLTESGDQLKGARHREQVYFVSMPGNRSIADASKINLNFRYAKNLDFDRSMVTVYINETPIGSKKLSMEMADRDHMALQVPKNLNIFGNFSVKIAFDLEMTNPGCIEEQDQMPWAFVDKESMLQLHTRDRADLLLDNYPYPFVRDGSYNGVAVVLPKDRDAYLYQSLANVFNLLGQFAQTNTGNIQFYSEEAGEKELSSKQIIAIGSYENNRVIQSNNEFLYFQFDPSSKGFHSNEKMSIDIDYGKRVGALQLINSPYDDRNGMLAVTGYNPEFYYLASQLVASEGLLWKVYGDGVLTDKDGAVRPFRFKEAAAPESPSIISDIMDRSDVLSFMVILVLVLLFVLVSLILMIRKYRSKRGRVE
ncbi:cellulose biosynthesis cyclic di-GMP-binding regulatory protein BcsB [Paenibacillus paeoniae]|nr:cellulose biosynthesis cyclic di-GMP-binding regulatory protein BcsB [Paenibacillus paeoniae]